MAPRRTLVVGPLAEDVGSAVRDLRHDGGRAAGYVGDDEKVAVEMADEILGGVDEVLRLPGDP